MIRVTCPTCLTVLEAPKGWAPGEPVVCASCDRRIWVGFSPCPPSSPASASRSADALSIEDLLAELKMAVPPPEERPVEPERRAVARPVAPRTPRWHRLATIGSVGLMIGFAVFVGTLYHPRGERAATSPVLMAVPSRGPEPPPTGPVSGPSPTTPARPVAAAVTLDPSFDRWLQDFVPARRQAKEQGKDVLLLFDASDWSEFSEALAGEVFAQPGLWARLTKRFVPVHIDFPEYPRAKRRVQNPERNEGLQARFFKYPAYPRVVLTDVDGRPYAIEWGYNSGEAEKFLASLERHQRKREDRDELLVAVDGADGEAKRQAAEAALNFLTNEVELPTPRGDGTYTLDLAKFYAPLLREWRTLADEQDPRNDNGYRERFFRADWGRRSQAACADDGSSPEALRALAEEFDTWAAGCRFKDGDTAADLLTSRAQLHIRMGDPQGAEKVARVALSLTPSPAWRATLARFLLPEAPARSGTGFAVAPGYVVTSNHVVQGPGAVRIGIRGREPVACEVVASDPGSDLALLKVALPPEVSLPPLRVAPRAPADRGTEVMALGYALGGENLKFTRGAVSARQEAPGKGLALLVLDQRVNPGNSGGPLCDANGNVIGVVTAKTLLRADLDSYGVAVPSGSLDRFLTRHLKGLGYQAAPPLQQKYEWVVLDRQVSPSVVHVQKGPGNADAGR